MIDDVRSKTVALARTSLADARVDLDDAVRSLSESDGETIMATSNIVGLLLRVVAAKEHLENVERGPSTGPPASLR
jgi:predicted site-specific integrase-resolvase